MDKKLEAYKKKCKELSLIPLVDEYAVRFHQYYRLPTDCSDEKDRYHSAKLDICETELKERLKKYENL